MKRYLSIFLVLCLLLTILSSAFTVLAAPEDEDDESEFEEYIDLDDTPGAEWDDEDFEDPVDIEEYYEDGDTIYDLENEEDAPVEPEEIPPPKDPDADDDDAEIYDDEDFDAENALQLQGEYIFDELIIKFKELHTLFENLALSLASLSQNYTARKSLFTLASAVQNFFSHEQNRKVIL